ncbi:MAG: 4'-phosphopantetheinyl transferase superfamily protein [Cyanobacteria bacterium M_surface_10_m2_179]|nr:4'-phosphopantetheinyl transferase superfamily protein [Cyanobacteria bacterium M_surface_10_m2_179]
MAEASAAAPMTARPHLWLLPLTAPPALCLSEAEQAWSTALPAPLQQRYRISRSLLRGRLAPLLQLPAAAVPLHSPPGEAPRLASGHGHVSLSHSRELLLLAWSPWPIGVDLEWQARPLQADLLARRFFPAQEWQQLQGLAPERRREAVLASWVRKEAAIKWQASSLARDLRHWCWDAAQQRLLHLQEGWQPPCQCLQRDGWLCGVVGEAVEPGIWG